jgi:hypothetical protein
MLTPRLSTVALPGPRTICARPRDNCFPNPGTDWVKLSFPKLHHAPNPAALSVCKESREVALNYYRLAFNTPNVYFDLTRTFYSLDHWMGTFL